MVYKFRLISKEVKGFVRDIDILSGQSFYDFHIILTQNFHYDSTQLASFIISNKKWGKLQEIMLFDFSEGRTKNIKLMDRCRISEHIKSIGGRVLYNFDLVNERTMFIELIETRKEDQIHSYPRISHSEKSPPPQLYISDANFDDLEFDE